MPLMRYNMLIDPYILSKIVRSIRVSVDSSIGVSRCTCQGRAACVVRCRSTSKGVASSIAGIVNVSSGSRAASSGDTLKD